MVIIFLIVLLMLMVLTLLHSIMLIEGKKRILVVEEGRIGKKMFV